MSDRHVKVGLVADFDVGSLTGVSVEGRRAVIANARGELYCVDDVCPHEECRFSEYGDLSGFALCCTCHMSTFDIRDGALIGGPAYGDATVLPVVIDVGAVFIALPTV